MSHPTTHPTVRRVAGIDCGTNSIRLLIADVDPVSGEHEDVTRLMEIVRLGQGVDRTGRLDDQALARTLAATARFAELCGAAGVEAVRFVATSATRDAANRDQFTQGVLSALGVEPEVISGPQEAELSFLGAAGSLNGQAAPFLVVDSGGGSTEFALGTRRPEQMVSIDIGCVRMTERHLHCDPPTANEAQAARDDVDAAIARAAQSVDFAATGTLVGLAGSATTITALALGLSSYQPERIHGAVHSAEEMIEACDQLLAMSRAQRLALGFMHPGRADVIGGGAIVWERVIRAVAAARREAGAAAPPFVTSEHDILDGIAISAARALG